MIRFWGQMLNLCLVLFHARSLWSGSFMVARQPLLSSRSKRAVGLRLATLALIQPLLGAVAVHAAPLSDQELQTITISQIKALRARAASWPTADRKIDTQLLDALPNITQTPGASGSHCRAAGRIRAR